MGGGRGIVTIPLEKVLGWDEVGGRLSLIKYGAIVLCCRLAGWGVYIFAGVSLRDGFWFWDLTSLHFTSSDLTWLDFTYSRVCPT